MAARAGTLRRKRLTGISVRPSVSMSNSSVPRAVWRRPATARRGNPPVLYLDSPGAAWSLCGKSRTDRERCKQQNATMILHVPLPHSYSSTCLFRYSNVIATRLFLSFRQFQCQRRYFSAATFRILSVRVRPSLVLTETSAPSVAVNTACRQLPPAPRRTCRQSSRIRAAPGPEPSAAAEAHRRNFLFFGECPLQRTRRTRRIARGIVSFGRGGFVFLLRITVRAIGFSRGDDFGRVGLRIRNILRRRGSVRQHRPRGASSATSNNIRTNFSPKHCVNTRRPFSSHCRNKPR